jgi:hypothetical protein
MRHFANGTVGQGDFEERGHAGAYGSASRNGQAVDASQRANDKHP